MTDDPRRVRELVGVYDADGSLRGELAYVARKVVGRAHCALCDITHAGVRRRKSFGAMVDELGVPFDLLHRDERPDDVVAATGGRAPMVLARTDEGLEPLLDASDLARCGHSPDLLFDAIVMAVEARGLRLG